MMGTQAAPPVPGAPAAEPGPALESWTWVLQRFTGVLLLVFVGGHLWVEHFLHVGQVIQFREIVARLAHALYLALDFGLLLTVVYHGLNGLRRVLAERQPKRGRALALACLLLGLVTTAWGADILSAFLFKHPWLTI
jgi:succinate dehydrogenase / fumarate reductase, membrane anchor subunit